jgi:hypothetical protein
MASLAVSSKELDDYQFIGIRLDKVAAVKRFL